MKFANPISHRGFVQRSSQVPRAVLAEAAADVLMHTVHKRYIPCTSCRAHIVLCTTWKHVSVNSLERVAIDSAYRWFVTCY